MKTPQRWRTSRVYVIIVSATLTLFGIMMSFCDVNRLAMRALTNWQTDRHTETRKDGNTAPILLLVPRPLTREVNMLNSQILVLRKNDLQYPQYKLQVKNKTWVLCYLSVEEFPFISHLEPIITSRQGISALKNNPRQYLIHFSVCFFPARPNSVRLFACNLPGVDTLESGMFFGAIFLELCTSLVEMSSTYSTQCSHVDSSLYADWSNTLYTNLTRLGLGKNYKLFNFLYHKKMMGKKYKCQIPCTWAL